MNWQDVIVGAVSGVSFTTVAMVAFGKGIFEKVFTQVLSRDLEKFKSDLALLVKRQEITFSRLHEKRATLIAEAYSILVDVDRHLSTEKEVLKNPPTNVPPQSFLDQGIRLKEFLRTNRLYFPDSLIEAWSSIEAQICTYYDNIKFLGYDALAISRLEEIIESIHSVQRATEAQFKQLLGSQE